MTTRLEFINKLLLGVSEREVTSTTTGVTPTARKALHSMQTAHMDVCTAYDWSWLQTTGPATGWLGNVATVADLLRLRAVVWDNYTILQAVPLMQVRVDNTLPFMCPSYYAQKSDNEYIFQPAPVLAEDRARIIFVYVRDPVLPALDADLFQMPERFLELVLKKALYYMFIRHVHDKGTAAYVQGEYEAQLDSLMSRERVNPVGSSKFNITARTGFQSHRTYLSWR